MKSSGNTGNNFRIPIIATIAAVFLISCGFVLLLIAYIIGTQSILDYYEAFGTVLFWAGIFGFVLAVPFRKVLPLYMRYLRSSRGITWFIVYLSVHLFVYGLLLEGIFIYVYRIPPIISQASVSVSAILAYPQSLVTMLEDFAFNPTLNIDIPPGLSLSLSLYSFVVALMIAILVVANIGKLIEVSKICTLRKKSITFVALPLLGVAGGAACCISLPFLIYLIAPATAYITNSLNAYYFAYLAFPAITAIALKLNLDSTARMAANLSAHAKISP